MTDEKEEYVYGEGSPTVVMPPPLFEPLVEDIRFRGQLIARNQKLESGVGATGFLGILIGILFALAMIMLPVVIIIGGI